MFAHSNPIITLYYFLKGDNKMGQIIFSIFVVIYNFEFFLIFYNSSLYVLKTL